MSKQVDERVVEMDFDNSKFEKNVQTTMSTLDKLKKALNLDGASKGLDNVNKSAQNVKLDGIASGVEALEKRFSTMGIVGATVIARLTNSMMNLAAKTTSFLTSGVIQGGITRAMNLENAHFQLQGLLKDEEAVSAVMKNVGDSVDGTAYSLDAAAKVASQLAASGMKAGDEMFTSLRAVAGVAAMTNSEYSDIGLIFTQVAGQGRLMGDQLLQLSGRGMNAAATLANYLGTTEENVRDMVTKGKIDFQTFANAMDDAFGEHAKKANETFTGAMSNVKAALGRIGAEFISPLIVQNGPLVQFFNVLRERINDVKSVIGPFADAFTGTVTKIANAATNGLKKLALTDSTSSWDELSKKVTDVGVSVDDFKSKLIETAKEHGVAIDEMISETGSFEASLKKGWLTTNIFTEALGKFSASSNEVSASTEDLNEKLRYFQEVVDKVWNGDYKNAPERYQLLAKAGYDYAKVQSLVNKTVDGHRLTLEDLGEEQLKSIGYTDEQIQALNELKKQAEETGTPLNKLIEDMSKPSDKEMLITGFKNVLEDIGKILQTVKDAWNEIFKSDDSNGSFIHNAIEGFYDLTNNMRITDETLGNLSTTLKGFFSAIDLGIKLGGGIFSFISGFVKILMNIFHIDLLGLTAKIGEIIIKFREWILSNNELVKNLTAVRDKLVDFATNAVGIFIDRLNELGGIFKTFIADLKLSEGFSFDNIANAFSNLWNNLKAYFSNFDGLIENIKSTIAGWVVALLDYLGIAGDAVHNFLDNMSWDNFIQALTEIGENIRNFASNFKLGDAFNGVGNNIIDGLVNGLKDGSGKVIETIVNIGSKLLEAIKALLGIHSPSTEFFEIGKNIIQGLINGIDSMLGPLWEFLKGIGQGILDIFNNMDWGVVLTTIAGVGVFTIFYKMAKAMQTLADAAKAFSAPFAAVGKVLDSFAGAIDNVGQAMSTKLKAEAIKSIAISIGILAGSIFLLAQLDVGKAWNAVGIIVVLSGVMAGLSYALSKFGGEVNGLDAAKLSATLLSLGAALILFAATMKIISGMSWEDLGKAAVGIAAMGGIVAALVAITKYAGSDKQIEQASKMIAKVGLALLVMAVVAKIVASMSWDDLGRAGAGIAGLSALIVGLVAATKLAGDDKKIASIGKTIFAVAGAIAMLAIVARLISGMSWEAMGKAAVGIGFLSAIIVGLVAATKLVGDKNIDKIGRTIFAIGGAMALLAVTARLISSMSWEAMGKAAVGITFLSAIVVGLVAATNLAGDKELARVGITLLAMSASIAILAGVCVILGLVKTENLVKGVLAVGALSVMVGIMVGMTRNAQDVKGTMIGIAVAIGVMAAALAVLSTIEPAKLAKAVVALSIVMGMFAIVEAASGSVSKSFGSIIVMTVAIGMIAAALGIISMMPVEQSIGSAVALSTVLMALSASLRILDGVGKISKSAITSMAAMLGIIAGIAVILGIMSALNVEASMTNVVALSVMLLAMAGVCAVLGTINSVSSEALAAMVVLTAVVAALAIILGIMSALDVNPSIETAASLSIMLIAMSVAVGILGAIAPLATAAIEGAAALVAVVGVLTAAVIAFGAISQIPGVDWLVSEGGNFLQKIGTAIGQFVGGIAGGVAEGATSTLPQVGSNLSAFMSNVQPFLDGMSSVDESILTNIGTLSAAIALLTASSFLDGITSFVTGESSLTDFANQLVPFGQAISAYSQTVAGVDAGAIQASVQAAQGLSQLANSLPKEGGLAQAIFGENTDLATFGTQLISFGQAISGYSQAVAGVDAAAISASAQAGQALSELANSLPKEGGLAQAIFGENTDLGTFGNQLSTFGQAIAGYSQSVAGLDVGPITQSVEAGKALTELANALPQEQGWVQKIFGGQDDLAGFGEKLASFGSALGKYSSSIGELDIGKMTSSIEAAKKVKELAESLKDFDASGIDNFKIDTLGQKLQDYGTKIASVDAGAISSSVSTIRNMINAINSMASINTSGVESFKQAVTSLSEVDLGAVADKFSGAIPQFTAIGTNLIQALTSGISSGGGNLVSTASSMMSALVASIQGRQGAFMAVGLSCMTALRAGMSSGVGTLIAIVNTLMMTMLAAIKGRSAMFMAGGLMLITMFKMGLMSGLNGVTSSIQSALSSCVGAIRSFQASFAGAGKDLGQGLVNGIKSKEQAAYDAGFELGKKAVQGEKDGQKSNSPSKLTIKAGKWLGEGLVIGMNRMGKAVYKAGKSMGSNAVDSISNSLGTVQNLISNIDNVTPTISPVVDMSGAQYQLSTFKLGGTIDAIVSQPVNSLATIVSDAQAKIDASNKEVVGAVNGLRDDLSTMYEADDQEIALYVDAKKLASSIAKPMNRQLNIISRREGGL